MAYGKKKKKNLQTELKKECQYLDPHRHSE